MIGRVEWLNYHHLLYFWTVAREGGISPAAERLRLAHPTISAQVHALERALGEKLFTKQGRRLVLTDVGRVVFGYADEIFGLGRELMDTVKGRPTGQPRRLVVGVADAVPKLIAKRLLEPALQHPDDVRLLCREGKSEGLLRDLASHSLDVVLADAPLPPGSSIRAFNHLLGECGIAFFAVGSMARPRRRGFPRSLDGAPLLLPSEATALRRNLDQWFDALGVRPRVVAEFDDVALLNVFGQEGLGIFPGPAAIEREVRRQYAVQVVGHVPDVRERFFAISIERRIKHPAVAAICQTARERLFRGSA